MLRQRTLTALVLAPAAVAMALLPPTWLFAIITAVAILLALAEWARMSGVTSIAVHIGYLVAAAACYVALWYLRSETIWWVVIAIGAVWWLLALAWLRHIAFAATPTAQSTAIKLVAGLLIVVPAWVAVLEIHQSQPYGHYWALFALVLIWAADTFAYFAGSRWGKAKLAPRISPGKTIVGVWGALIGSGVIAVIGGLLLGLHNLPLVFLIAIALIAVAFSVIGDLFESLIKRHANIKDSGALFPGHGGLFDRLDGVFAALPVFALGKTLLDLLFPT